MKKPANRKLRVPEVDLLDPTVEPTDAELGALMHEMRRAVRKKDAKTRRAARANMKAAVRDTAQDAGRQKTVAPREQPEPGMKNPENHGW